jgi:serine kinase
MSKSLNGGASVSRREEEFELKRRGYAIDKIIGEGSYGKVKRAFSEKIQIRVAIKIINMNKAPKDFINKFLPRELRLHPMLDHTNIIRMYEVLEFHNKVS